MGYNFPTTKTIEIEIPSADTISVSNVKFERNSKTYSFFPPTETYIPKLTVEKIIFHPPATIVYWGDGTKTVVKTAPETSFSEFHGFCAALAKKYFGSKAEIMREIEKAIRIPLK